jgi:hypothetical protein
MVVALSFEAFTAFLASAVENDGVEDPEKARGEQEREQGGVSGVPEDQGLAEETKARAVCMCYTTT